MYLTDDWFNGFSVNLSYGKPFNIFTYTLLFIKYNDIFIALNMNSEERNAFLETYFVKVYHKKWKFMIAGMKLK